MTAADPSDPMHRGFLDHALALADAVSRDGSHGPFGAVVVCGDRIVGTGCNCVTAHCDPTAHAEINAIRAAAQALRRHNLHDCVLYSSCEPCPMCLAAIGWAHMATVYYAAGAEAAQAAGFDDIRIRDRLCSRDNRHSPQLIQLPHAQASAALERWTVNPQRRDY